MDCNILEKPRGRDALGEFYVNIGPDDPFALMIDPDETGEAKPRPHHLRRRRSET